MFAVFYVEFPFVKHQKTYRDAIKKGIPTLRNTCLRESPHETAGCLIWSREWIHCPCSLGTLPSGKQTMRCVFLQSVRIIGHKVYGEAMKPLFDGQMCGCSSSGEIPPTFQTSKAGTIQCVCVYLFSAQPRVFVGHKHDNSGVQL